MLYGLVTISVETFCTNNYPALTSFIPNNDLNLTKSRLAIVGISAWFEPQFLFLSH